MIAMCGGGTGGHLAVVRAVSSKVKSTPMIYIGSTTVKIEDG